MATEAPENKISLDESGAGRNSDLLLDDYDVENEVDGWDEGGNSDCGYGERVHDVLMTIGSTIHTLVGEPSEAVQDAMKHIGNWFQEASYAARDLSQGNMNVGEETLQAVKMVVSGDDNDEDELDDGRVMEDDAKLRTIKES